MITMMSTLDSREELPNHPGYRADGNLAIGDKRPYFVSRNFHNVLHWEKTERVRGGGRVLYSVMYRRLEDEQPLLSKRECQNITGRSCDLTAETPPLPDVHYEAVLHANGRVVGNTYRFLPVAATILGAPQLSMRVSGSSLHLNVTLPLGPGGIPLLELLNRTRRLTLDPVVSYTLTIEHPHWAEQVNHSRTGRYDLLLMNNNTEYCGHVVYKPTIHIGRPLSENTSFCVLMPRDHWAAVPWVLMAGGLVLVPVVLSTILVYLYTHPRKKPHLPFSMQGTWTSSTQPILLCPQDLKLVCSVPVVCPFEARKPPTNHNLVSRDPGGYSPQCDPCEDNDEDLDRGDRGRSASRGRPPWKCRSTTTQSSVSYAHVTVTEPVEDASGPCVDGVIHMPFQDGVSHMPFQDGVSHMPFQDGVSHMPFQDGVIPREHVVRHGAHRDPGDNPAGTLVLPAVRNPQGELMLSMLAFQSQASGEEEEEEEEEKLLVNAGYKAQGPPRLLLSLNSMGMSEDWDSECDQSATNTPSQFSVISGGSPTRAFPAGLWSPDPDPTASGYKQNWFTVGETPCGYTMGHRPRTQPEEVGEEEEEEEEQGDGQVFLRGWLVRVQE
ncbi:unnamed protein product [Lota lota]